MKFRFQFLLFFLSIFGLMIIFSGVLGTLIYFWGNQLLFWILFFFIHYLICLIFIIFNIYSDWDSAYSLTAIAHVVLFPYVGIYVFLIITRRRYLSLKLKKWSQQHHEFQMLIKKNSKLPTIIPPSEVSKFAQFTRNFSIFPFSYNNKLIFFDNPMQKINHLHKSLKAAKKYIYFNFYLFSDGQYLEILQRLLIQKFEEGVEVRIIYDAFGTATHSSLSFVIRLRKAGIILKSFGTMSPFLPNILARNHRKDIIIDGKIAYTGGSNIGDEYLSLSSEYGFFCDLDICLEGNVVRDIELIFWKDWMICSNESIFKAKQINKLRQLSNTNYIIKPHTEKKWMQVTDDGPENRTSVNHDLFFNLFTQAQTRIWFTTPYFYIDAELNKALVVAALRGVDVRIFLHNFERFKILVDLSRLHYDELLKAGVKIFEFSRSYLHSKLILIDDNFLSIGTANIDFNSFYYCNQTTLLIFDQQLNHEITIKYMSKVIENSIEVKQNPLKRKNWFYRVFLKFIQLYTVFL